MKTAADIQRNLTLILTIYTEESVKYTFLVNVKGLIEVVHSETEPLMSESTDGQAFVSDAQFTIFCQILPFAVKEQFLWCPFQVDSPNSSFKTQL